MLTIKIGQTKRNVVDLYIICLYPSPRDLISMLILSDRIE